MTYRYRVTLERLGDDGVAAGRLEFAAVNHDDILAIVKKVEAGTVVPREKAAAFAVGLKLFSDVALRHRSDPLFAELMPHLGAFIKALKGTLGRSAAAGSR